MNILGMLAQQAAQGAIVGAAGSRPGTSRSGEYEDEYGNPVVGGSRRPRPLFPPFSVPHTTDNVDTNRYQDNKNDKDDKKCKLFPYKERKTKCPGGDDNAHHAIPDHCWRMGNSVYLGLAKSAVKLLPWPLSGEAVQNVASQAFEESKSYDQSKYYYPKMNKEEGLAICVEGKGKSGVHGLIHTAFDKEEYRLGEAGDPKWTAKLGDLEDRAAASIAAETGCDPVDLKKQLRDYHQEKNLGEDSKLRADPFGKNTTSLTDFQVDPIVKMRMPDHSW